MRRWTLRVQWCVLVLAVFTVISNSGLSSLIELNCIFKWLKSKWKNWTVKSPMTALGSVPKAHTQGDPDGTWNLEKLHLELKYFGRKLAEAKLQRKEINQWEWRWGQYLMSKWSVLLTSIPTGTFPVSKKINLDCLFLLESSAAKMCTVPWSLDTQMRDESWLKLILEKRVSFYNLSLAPSQF